MSNTASQSKGRFGEDIAAEYLERHGYRIIDKNVHMSHKELDIIAEDDNFLVFVEVKTRSVLYEGSSAFGTPARAVDRKKCLNTVYAAESYLRAHPTNKQPRIDVIEIYIQQTNEAKRTTPAQVLSVNHIRNAFDNKGRKH